MLANLYSSNLVFIGQLHGIAKTQLTAAKIVNPLAEPVSIVTRWCRPSILAAAW